MLSLGQDNRNCLCTLVLTYAYCRMVEGIITLHSLAIRNLTDKSKLMLSPPGGVLSFEPPHKYTYGFCKLWLKFEGGILLKAESNMLLRACNFGVGNFPGTLIPLAKSSCCVVKLSELLEKLVTNHVHE